MLVTAVVVHRGDSKIHFRIASMLYGIVFRHFPPSPVITLSQLSSRAAIRMNDIPRSIKMEINESEYKPVCRPFSVTSAYADLRSDTPNASTISCPSFSITKDLSKSDFFM